MAYTPPPGSGVYLPFSSGYSPPPGGAVTLDFTPPAGGAVYPPPVQTDAQFGSPGIVNTAQAAQFAGFDSQVFGTAAIINLRQAAYPSGWDAVQWGWTTAYTPPPKQYARNATAGSTLAIGTQFVSHYIRYLLQTSPFSGATAAASLVAYRIRYVEVPWSSFTQWGSTRVSRKIFIDTVGADSARLGTAAVDWLNAPRPSGWSSVAFGTAEFSRSPRVLRPSQLNTLDFGSTLVWNSRQYVAQLYDARYELDHGFGQYTWIYTRNRTIGVPGWSSQKFGIGAYILNTGRAVVQSQPTEATQWGAGTFIAYKNRAITPEIWEPGRVSRYAAVYNNARVLEPKGFNSAVVPKVYWVESNKRFIKQYFGPETEFGTPFIADRVRTVSLAYSYTYTKYGAPTAALRTQYLAPTGFAPGVVAPPTLIGPFHLTIRPRWTMRDRYGEPTVRNKTPQLFNRGSEQTEFSTKAWVSFRVRSITEAKVGPQTSFGRTAISDRRQWVNQLGRSSLVIPDTLRVALENPDLPSTRVLFPDGVAPNNLFGFPTFRKHPTPGGWGSLQFGTAWIRVQGCSPRWDFPDSQFSFGRPSLNATQYVDVDGTDSSEFGWQRSSPHTIYATLTTPPQAVANHPGRTFTLIDSGPFGQNPTPPWFGTTWIYRVGPQYIYHWHNGELEKWTDGRPGTPVVELKRRYITPAGIRSNRFGYPTLPTLQWLWAGDLAPTAFGDVTLTRPPYPHTVALLLNGYSATQWGATQIENFNRNVYPQGFSATVYGNNNPMVHYPRRVYPGGYTATQYGASWVSDRVRVVETIGADSFEEGYTPGQFAGRLRVTQTVYGNDGALAQGADSSEFGQAELRLTTQRINPYMIPPPRFCWPHTVTRSN